MPALVALVVLAAVLFAILHPDPEALARAEYPAPAGKPMAHTPLQTGIVAPLDTGITNGGVMHPAPDCPAPDRGFNPLYRVAAHQHQQSGCRLHSLAERESNQKPDARSPAGALGMMQFVPATAHEFGVDPLVPGEAVDGAARYLEWLEKRFQHVGPEDRPRMVLSAYNWGVGNVRRTGCSTWDCLRPLLPRETRIYVAGVEAMMRDGSWYREAGPHA